MFNIKTKRINLLNIYTYRFISYQDRYFVACLVLLWRREKLHFDNKYWTGTRGRKRIAACKMIIRCFTVTIYVATRTVGAQRIKLGLVMFYSEHRNTNLRIYLFPVSSLLPSSSLFFCVSFSPSFLFSTSKFLF